MSRLNLAVWACLAALVMAPRLASAQAVEVTPFGGYRFGGDPFEYVTGTAIDTDGAPVVGLLLDVFVSRGMAVSFLFSHQDARLDADDGWNGWDGAAGGGVDARLSVDHWQAGGTQTFGDGVSRPFITGGLGLTRLGWDSDSEVRFSLSGGGGVKLMPTRHLGVRLEGRVYSVFVDGESRGSICTSGNCLIGLNVSVNWQAEFTAGLVVAF